MKKAISESEVDAILTNEKIMAGLQQEKNHLKRLIQGNRSLAYRIWSIHDDYCNRTGSDVHEASYSKGILTHRYLKGKSVFRVKVGAIKPRGGFSKTNVADITLGKINQ